MKRILCYPLFLLLFTLFAIHVYSNDSIIGQTFPTDIRAYINGCEIPACNIDGSIVVFVSDLRGYGFQTAYDDAKRESHVQVKPYKPAMQETETGNFHGIYTGSKSMGVYATDITVSLNGTPTVSFNVEGNMAIPMRALQCFGTYWYDDRTRSSHLTLPGYPIQEKQAADKAEALSTMTYRNSPLGYPVLTKNTTVLSGGSYPLGIGVMGYRVRCVQRYVGEQCRKYGMYTEATQRLVCDFQRDNGLPETGEVDLSTWLAMGYTEEQWKIWDTYVHPSEVTADMTREDIIEKFISIAYTYLGAEYIFGCAGSPAQGGDCSGFVLSCLYGIGINPEGYDSQQHNFIEYNSRLMWADEHFQKVDFSDRAVGDLVFYCDANGVIIHVAIYLGNDLCIEACRTTIEVMSLYKYSMKIAGIKRVLYA